MDLHHDEPWQHAAIPLHQPTTGATTMQSDHPLMTTIAQNALLVEALSKMVKAHADLSANTDGEYPPLEASCNDCTQGCTPASADRGLCPYHFAQRVLRNVVRRSSNGGPGAQAPLPL